MKIVSVFLFLLAVAVPLCAQPSITQSRPLAFTHVTVIDMTGAPPRSDLTVVITGNRITTVGPASRVRVPGNAEIIDATGKFLIPGLWDMHFHVKEVERTFPLFIANGVTGVRNMGGDFLKLFAWRGEVVAGTLLGPRLVTGGPVIDGPQAANPDHALSVANAVEARRAVDFLKRSGADFVKVYDGVPEEAYLALADEARKQGLPFVGHIPRASTMKEASRLGQKSIEHLGTFLEESTTAEIELRNWRAAPMKSGDFSAIPARIAARGNRMLDTYSEQKAGQLLVELVRNKTWQVPTLRAKWVNTNVDELSMVQDPRYKYIPAAIREGWTPQKNFFFRYRTPEFITYQKRLFPKEMEIVGAMNRAGVPILAGTDGGPYTVPGFGIHQELALLVKAGLTPMQALQAATINPAKFLGEQTTLGTVEQGKIANLLLLESSPLEDISNTQRIEAVVVDGRCLPKMVLRMMLAGVEKAANER